MPRWTKAEYEAHQARVAASSAKPKQAIRDEPVGKEEGKTENTTGVPRRIVRITSYRRRLLDPDNLAGGCKYFLDCCKYSQLIQDDRPQDIELIIKQVKVKTKEEERTEIEVTIV